MSYFEQLTKGANAYIALALLALVLAVPGLARMPVMDRDEARFAQASSQMMETGDYVVIRYHTGLRNKKPVGIHWLQSAAVNTLSKPADRNIAIYRLPSLLGAILAGWAMVWGGASLFGRRNAFLGAAILTCTLIVSSEAHIAKTDAAQLGFCTLAMMCLARMRDPRIDTRKLEPVLFWICVGAGTLLKGPITPMVVGLAAASLALLERRWDWLKPLASWTGLTIFAVMVIPWVIAVQIATEGEFLWVAAKVDLGQKLVDAAEGHAGPPGFHLAALPVLFWPGTLLLIPGVTLAVSQLVSMRRTSSAKTSAAAAKADALSWSSADAGAWRFLACWIVPSWLVFEIAPTKLPHYTLPLYPALALMAAAAAERWLDTRRLESFGGRWLALALFAAVSVLVIAIASPWMLDALRHDAAGQFGRPLGDRVEWLWANDWKAYGPGVWGALLIAAAVAAVIWAFVRREPLLVLLALTACSVTAGVMFRAFILPSQTWVLATEQAMSALKEVCAFPEGSARWAKSECEGKYRPPKLVRAIDFAEPSFVFEMGGKVTIEQQTTTQLPAIAEDNRPAWLINAATKRGKQAIDEIISEAASADRCVQLARRYALNYSNGNPHELVALVVEPAGCGIAGPPSDLRPAQDDAPALEGGGAPTPAPR